MLFVSVTVAQHRLRCPDSSKVLLKGKAGHAERFWNLFGPRHQLVAQMREDGLKQITSL
jgi:hypothetical protein